MRPDFSASDLEPKLGSFRCNVVGSHCLSSENKDVSDSTCPGLTGSTVKCIRSQDGNWFTLQEFELKGGYKTCNWRNCVRCDGKTLKFLMKVLQ